jgi:hypothetical protein
LKNFQDIVVGCGPDWYSHAILTDKRRPTPLKICSREGRLRPFGLAQGMLCAKIFLSRTSVVSRAVCTLSKAAVVVIPAEAESSGPSKSWIPARPLLAKAGMNAGVGRNDVGNNYVNL